MIDRAQSERIALKKFRPHAVNICMHEEDLLDSNLLKWLRANDLNVAAAEEMLTKVMQWRRDNKVDRLRTWKPPPQFLTDYPYDLQGEGKWGHPVIVLPFGKWDLPKAYARGQKQEVRLYMIQLLERAMEMTRIKCRKYPTRPFINQCILIWDMEGFSMRKMTSSGTMDTVVDTTKLHESKYPGFWKAIVIINAPKIFSRFFAMIKPVISERTLSVLQVYGKGSNKWKEALSNLIPYDELLEHYGGIRRVNKEFEEMKNRKPSMIEEDSEQDKRMCVVTVEAKDQVKVALDVTCPNTTLRWKFYTEEFDIGFYILFEDKNLTLLNRGRVDSHVEVQEGTYTAVIPGRYVLVFDNTYSRYRAKTLHHHITETWTEGGSQDEHLSVGVQLKE